MTQENFGETPLRKPKLWLVLAVAVIWLLCGGLSLLGGSTRHTVGYSLSVAAIIIAIYALLFSDGVDRVIQVIGLIIGGLGVVLFSTNVNGKFSHRLDALLVVMTAVTFVALPCLLGLIVVTRKVKARIGKPAKPPP
jgi:hypothetical protein